MKCTLALASTGAAFCNRNSATSQWPARDAMCRGVSTFYKYTLTYRYMITYSKITIQAQLAAKTYTQSEIKENVAFKTWNSVFTVQYVPSLWHTSVCTFNCWYCLPHLRHVVKLLFASVSSLYSDDPWRRTHAVGSVLTVDRDRENWTCHSLNLWLHEMFT